MIFVRKEIDIDPIVLGVNPVTYAELVSDDSSDYKFNFTVGLKIKSTKVMEEYETVTVTVRSKQGDVKGGIKDIGSTRSTVDSGKIINSMVGSRDIDSLKPKNKFSPDRVLPSSVAEKAFSGLRILRDIKYVEPKIFQKTVNVKSQIRTSLLSEFHVTELFAPDYKDSRMTWRNVERERVSKKSSIDVDAILNRINSERRDISEAVADSYYGKFTSETNFYDVDAVMRNAGLLAKPKIFYDIVKYYLVDVPKSSRESLDTWYSVSSSVKRLNKLDVKIDEIVIPKSNENSILDVKFELYKKDATVPSETLTVDLDVKKHVGAYKIVHNPPLVSADLRHETYIRSSLVRSIGPFNRTYSLKISDQDEAGVIKKFNIYLKSIDRKGVTSPYELIGSVKNSSSIPPFTVKASSPLSVVRVVPVDSFERESNIFTNLIVGEGWNAIGNLTITPFQLDSGKVQVQVYNVPRNAISLTLWRRDCTESVVSPFESAPPVPISSAKTLVLTDHKGVRSNRTYEYYATVECSDGTRLDSNQTLYKVPDAMSGKGAYVSIGSQRTSRLDDGYLEVEFELKTTIDDDETKFLTSLLKSQSEEMYNIFLKPDNNASLPTGKKIDGADYFTDLFVHSVVRTNLKTGERETFPLQGDGIFRDNAEVQNKNGINPINPQQEYIYQVFTFRKDPIEAFKNYVAVVKPVDGSPEWFYLPYKWRSMRSDGTLYADDDNGIPIISQNDLLTSVSYGLTTSFSLKGSAQFADVTDIIADRIDRDTVKVTWKASGGAEVNKVNLYDSFVVMKVVNGIRSFLGCTSKNYIYHELSEKDMGSVYYIVVPVMSEFDIDTPAYSNSIVIDNEGLVPSVRVPSVS